MGAVGDVYQLIDDQRLLGQVVENVYFYRLDTPVVGNAAQFLAEAFIDTVLPDVLQIQTSDTTHRAIKVTNLFNESEAHTELISENGAGGTNSLPPFNAAGFSLIGDNAAVRDGAKRFAGIDESVQLDGVFDNVTYLGDLAALALTLAGGLAIGLDIDALVPVIVQRLKVDGEYKLPTAQGQTQLSRVIDALFNVDTTSQTSRKKGRGV